MPHFGEAHGVSVDDYIIQKIGNRFFALDNRGFHRYSNPGLVNTIQWAHDQLPDGGGIGVKARNYAKEWEAKLLITNDGIDFHGGSMWGTIFQAIDGLDDDMIDCTGLKPHLHNFKMDGNTANQASGNGINFRAGAAQDVHMHDVYLFYIKETGMLLQAGAGYFRGVYIEYAGKYGWSLSGSDRNVFVQCGAYACVDIGWYLINAEVTENQFLGCRAALSGAGKSGWVLQEAINNSFLGCHSQENGQYGFWFYGAQKNSFVGCHAYDNTDIDYYLSSLGGVHSLCNTFGHCFALSTSAYGWRDADVNQNNNIVTSCISPGCHTTGEIVPQSIWITDNNRELAC